MTSEKLQTWNKLQILEAGTVLQSLLLLEGFAEGAEVAQFFTEDLIDVLEGKIKPPPMAPITIISQLESPPNAQAREVITIPGIGFVPVLGEINVDENLLTWYTDDEQDEPGEYCPKCKTYTGYPDVDGDICCADCCTVVRFVSQEATQ